MSNAALTVSHLSKKYKIGSRRPYRLLSQTITGAIQEPWRKLSRIGKPTPPSQIIWALKDISFELPRHQVMGIVGRNGAGKSTLLKILSRVTEPTEGRIEMFGRAAGLLEVGTGFHPELTGRENIFLNGSILGMSKREIERKFDEIVAFSEIEKFIDTPVKHYSSGMGVRLAFSVAAHLEPEILLVDEVLAVGDLRFQKKCLAKMQSVVGNGRTILFVSHQMNTIRKLCSSCIWMEDGSVKMIGSTAKVVNAYESAALSQPISKLDDNVLRKAGTKFLRWEIVNNTAEEPNWLKANDPFVIKFTLAVPDRVVDGVHGIFLWNDDDQLMWGYEVSGLELDPGVHEFIYHFPCLPLRPATYRWQVVIFSHGKKVDDWFAVPDMVLATLPMTHLHDEGAGILNVPCEFSSEQVRGLPD
jgi:ABC-type polysaccharide/polyol phosphate transport system ATPase subunit